MKHGQKLGALVIALAPALLLGCKVSRSGDGNPSASATSGPVTPAEVTGIPACDRYLAAYECELGKLGLDGMPKTKASIAQMKETYRAGAQTPEGRESLDKQCSGQLERLKANPDSASCVGAR